MMVKSNSGIEKIGNNIYLCYDVPPNITTIGNKLKEIVFVFSKINQNSPKWKNNTAFILAIIETTNGQYYIFPRYSDKSLFEDFLETWNLKNVFNNLISKIKDNITNSDSNENKNIEEILENDKELSKVLLIYKPTNPEEINEFKNSLLYIFGLYKRTPLYYYEPKTFSPQDIEELAIELAYESVVSDNTDIEEDNMDNGNLEKGLEQKVKDKLLNKDLIKDVDIEIY